MIDFEFIRIEILLSIVKSIQLEKIEFVVLWNHCIYFEFFNEMLYKENMNCPI